jgi:hypothetical protein
MGRDRGALPRLRGRKAYRGLAITLNPLRGAIRSRPILQYSAP